MIAPLCLSCRVPMQSLHFKCVELDLCPHCRGVWLDHGELEKLMTYAAGEGAPPRRRPAHD